MMNETAYDTALAKLESVLTPRGRVLTAFSGGVDSTLVAAVARRALGRANAPACIGDSLSLPRQELDLARSLARTLDLELIETTPREQESPEYRANHTDRCYHCKTHLYDVMIELAAERGIRWIANGANLDDLGDHRPGMRAAAEHAVISPLIDAQLGKSEVRALAHQLDLPNWDKPAAACLASRIPYGTEVTPQRLAQVEQAEAALHHIGLRGFRVRHHDTVARIEAPHDQWDALLRPDTRAAIIAAVKSTGFTYVALDLEGFRSGSGNLVTLNIPRP